MTAPRYDRPAASQILADLAHPGLFAGADTGGRRTIAYAAHRMAPEPGSHLTLSQRLYLEKFMRPCPPGQVTSATHRITWSDSGAVPCTGHYTAGGLGPIVAIAARETTLALWRALDADRVLAAGISRLGEPQRAVLAGTTTDQEPREIFRIGVSRMFRAVPPDVTATGFSVEAAAASGRRADQRRRPALAETPLRVGKATPGCVGSIAPDTPEIVFLTLGHVRRRGGGDPFYQGGSGLWGQRLPVKNGDQHAGTPSARRSASTNA